MKKSISVLLIGISFILSSCSYKPFQENVQCGDNICNGNENLSNCAYDCHICGNNVCEPTEKPENCKQDCCGYCGDGKCVGYGCGENPTTCKADCGTICGNGVCDKGESPTECPKDCDWTICGNWICENNEDKDCPQDCGQANCRYIGEITCFPENGETYRMCLDDGTFSGLLHCNVGEICKNIVIHQDHYSGECTGR